MNYAIETEIEIAASAATVWNVLSDLERYPEWNPFVRRINGRLRVGERIEVVLEQKGSKPMTIRPRLVAVEPGVGFGWLGRLMVRNVLDGEHWFEIRSIDAERVVFRHSERFSGLLLPLLRGMFENKTKPSFELMNRALKERAEAP